MNKKIIFVMLALVLISSIVSANYLVQLKYENGVVTQEAVYETSAAPTQNYEGALNLSIGTYSTSIEFPLLVSTDGQIGTRGVHEVQSAETFVVIPTSTQDRTITITDVTGNTLLSEPLKEVTTPEMIAQGQTESDSTGTGLVIGGVLLLVLLLGIGIVVLIVILVVVYFVFLKKKTQEDNSPKRLRK
jgi:flagellar basal body-associated protein FliL